MHMVFLHMVICGRDLMLEFEAGHRKPVGLLALRASAWFVGTRSSQVREIDGERHDRRYPYAMGDSEANQIRTMSRARRIRSQEGPRTTDAYS